MAAPILRAAKLGRLRSRPPAVEPEYLAKLCKITLLSGALGTTTALGTNCNIPAGNLCVIVSAYASASNGLSAATATSASGNLFNLSNQFGNNPGLIVASCVLTAPFDSSDSLAIPHTTSPGGRMYAIFDLGPGVDIDNIAMVNGGSLGISNTVNATNPGEPALILWSFRGASTGETVPHYQNDGVHAHFAQQHNGSLNTYFGMGEIQLGNAGASPSIGVEGILNATLMGGLILVSVKSVVTASFNLPIGHIPSPSAVRGAALAFLAGIGHIPSPSAVRGLAFTKLAAIGHIASPSAVRGLAFTKLAAVGHIASAAAVRGLGMSKGVAIGHITGPKAVRGLSFSKLMTSGHIAAHAAVRGLAFAKLMASGHITGPKAVRGTTANLVAKPLIIWRKGGDSGGGFAHVGAAHPYTPNLAALGGDIWGAHVTFNRGDYWTPRNNGSPNSGGCDVVAEAWSVKNRWRCYCGTGTQQNSLNSGKLAYFDLNDATLGNRWKMTTVAGTQGVYGFGASTELLSPTANSHKRPVGRRIVVDYDVDTGTEYVYWLSNAGLVRGVDTGSGLGSLTLIGGGSINAANAWTALALAKDGSLYLSSYRTVADYALNTGSGSQVFRVTSPRTAASGSGIGSALGSAPGVVEDLYVDPVTGDIWAACGPNGVYKVTANGATWTQQSAATFTGLWCTSVFARGTTILVGTRFPPAGSGKSLAMSTNSGGTWAWKVSSNNNEFGTGIPWWLADHPDVMLGGDNFVVSQIEMDAEDSNIIYVFGRSGCTMTRDGGTTWQQASVGANGSLLNGITPGVAGAATADNQDWGGYDTADHFTTVTRVAHTIAGNNGGPVTVGGHTYQVSSATPPIITRDGVDITDDLFKAASGASQYDDLKVSDDGVIYVALGGGGTLVGWMKMADVGHIPAHGAVRGVSFAKLMAVGHIATHVAVRGLALVKRLTVGKILSSWVLRGLGLSTGPSVDWSRTVQCECYSGYVTADIAELNGDVEIADVLLDSDVAYLELDLDLGDISSVAVEVH